MAVDLVEPDCVAVSTTPLSVNPVADKRERTIELILVLAVAFSASIVGSIIILITNGSIASHYDNTRFAMGICSEGSSLTLLWYVLSRQKRTWRNLTQTPDWIDVPRGIGVFVLSSIVLAMSYYTIQMTSFAVTHHWLHPKSLDGLLAVGVTLISVMFMVVNGFFEELIVRAYLMTEIRELGGSAALAVLISLIVQVSYHLYQGWINAVMVGTMFAVFSVYYLKTRRIGPVIFAHILIDLFALLRHH